jgi:hypothetical protein
VRPEGVEPPTYWFVAVICVRSRVFPWLPLVPRIRMDTGDSSVFGHPQVALSLPCFPKVVPPKMPPHFLAGSTRFPSLPESLGRGPLQTLPVRVHPTNFSSFPSLAPEICSSGGILLHCQFKRDEYELRDELDSAWEVRPWPCLAPQTLHCRPDSIERSDLSGSANSHGFGKQPRDHQL